MSSKSIIVIGASRGIGLELVKYLSEDPSSQVFATMRKPMPMTESNIHVIELDQTSTSSVQKAALQISEADILIVNGAMGADERLTGITSERFSEYMATNVVGPHRVMNAFLPALRSRKTRIIVYISSIVASITKEVNSNWGLQGPYATSKAAGNMLTVQFHNELRGEGFIVVAIHPGWVATDMGNLAGPGAMPARESVEKIMHIVDRLKLEDSATFFNIDGSTLPY